jgi:hypothetical protein
MIPLKAVVTTGKRVRLNPSSSVGAEYDDNVICLWCAVTDGPQNMLDRKISVFVGITEFIDKLPADVLVRLKDEINSRS